MESHFFGLFARFMVFPRKHEVRKRLWLVLVMVGCSLPSSAQAAPSLTASVEGAGGVRLSWSTSAGKDYTLQFKSVLEGAWTNFQTAPFPLRAPGAQLSYVVPTTAGMQFFRVAETGETPPPALPDPQTLASQITGGTTPAEVVRATALALAAGGIMVGDVGRVDFAAHAPAASWMVDPQILFNMASEAHNRAVSGRFTIGDLGQLWSDMGFPFAGAGTPGEQLLNFLRRWAQDAASQPASALNFTPRFVAAMTGYQQPPVDLSSPLVQPGDVRLSLLEVDLLMAAFDRLFQIDPATATATAEGSRAPAQSLAASNGACDKMKEYLGSIGTKGAQKVVSYGQDTLTDGALGAIGMTTAEIAQFKTYEKFFSGLDMAMKVVKMLQIYASTEVKVTVDGPDPIHKPHKSSARVLQTLTARAGIPEQDWKDFQKNNKSDTYNDLKSCLDFSGMPLPSDLAEIGNNVDSWRVSWQPVSGTPKHALIPGDVNNFDGSSAGHPFGMKLARDGAASAKASLKLEIQEESPMASLFAGPLKTTPVVMKANVFTAEPPSPDLILKVTTLVGTLSALLDLSVEWIKTAFPPASTARFMVEYHELPMALDASLQLDTRFHYQPFSGEPPLFEMTAKGNWNARLNLETNRLASGREVEGYTGVGTFNYLSATSKFLEAPTDDCLITYSERVFSGAVAAHVTGAYYQNGTYAPELSEVIAFGIQGEATAPSEIETMIITCPDETQSFDLPRTPKIALAAITTLNLMETGALEENGLTPGNPLLTWSQNADGSISRTFTGPKSVTVRLSNGTTAITDVLSQHNAIKLTPIFPRP